MTESNLPLEAARWQASNGKWYWHVRSSGNHEVLADGGDYDGPSAEANIVHAVELLTGPDRVVWYRVEPYQG